MLGALQSYAIALHLIPTVLSEAGTAWITVDRERINDNETFTMRCSFPSYLSLTSATLEASKNANITGSLYCNVPLGSTTSTGVLAGMNFAGCPTYPGGSGYVSVIMMASPILEQNYTCTLRVNDGNTFFSLISSNTSLELSVFPEPVSLDPSAWTFNETDDLTISCKSQFGKPPARLNMTIFYQTMPPVWTSGFNLVSMALLRLSRYWHQATINCTVENHIAMQNATANQVLLINYIVATDIGTTASTWASNATLNCSMFVLSYPGVRFRWSVSQTISVSDPAVLSSPIFTVPKGQSGDLNCTATNTISMKNVTIYFIISNTTTNSATTTTGRSSSQLSFIKTISVNNTQFLWTDNHLSPTIRSSNKASPTSGLQNATQNTALYTSNDSLHLVNGSHSTHIYKIQTAIYGKSTSPNKEISSRAESTTFHISLPANNHTLMSTLLSTVSATVATTVNSNHQSSKNVSFAVNTTTEKMETNPLKVLSNYADIGTGQKPTTLSATTSSVEYTPPATTTHNTSLDSRTTWALNFTPTEQTNKTETMLTETFQLNISTVEIIGVSIFSSQIVTTEVLQSSRITRSSDLESWNMVNKSSFEDTSSQRATSVSLASEKDESTNTIWLWDNENLRCGSPNTIYQTNDMSLKLLLVALATEAYLNRIWMTYWLLF